MGNKRINSPLKLSVKKLDNQSVSSVNLLISSPSSSMYIINVFLLFHHNNIISKLNFEGIKRSLFSDINEHDHSNSDLNDSSKVLSG